MKKFYTAFSATILTMVLFMSSTVTAQLDFLPQGSQLASVSQRIGNTDITITYSRPSVNGREIWGALVPYGMNNLGFGTATESPWRAGANENTVFKTTHDLTIGGKTLPAGKYGLHMIVNEDNTATVIFSNNHGAWGSYFYEPSEDALRVDVETNEIPHTELLTYSFDEVGPNSAVASLKWEKKQIPFTAETDVTANVLAEIRQQMQTSPGFNRQTWEQAANYALNNGGDLDEALSWANAAIEGQFFSQKNFNNLSLKAQILERQGKTAEAKAVMDEAMPMGTVFEIHGYGRQLIAQGKKDEALAVFKWNAKANKGTWPVDFGLARGYSAVGNYKTALKHLKIAEGRAPDQLNKNAIVGYITQLEAGTDIN
ncbi:DUF2911 domain-containing protein [Muricauda sp. CAU 1633]|uniref:DUF2911 domain-containing protein n=1 Tax=Allomuricauda sp. CAU 1633 TaxID=2816036 RepID=UPI001A8FEF0F|nr:DUF2911 domain-containing protein [Muricauda sp. CAU 1633]MBO0323098.1 DUF2911 domain-containing protein [Muricauda sp. CAU 1633]